MRSTRYILILCLLAYTALAKADIRLPALISDGMVLQRNTILNVWGWAQPGEKVEIKFAGKSIRVTTNGTGNWLVKFPPLKAGGPYIMDIKGKNHILVNDILIGDVWFCSGQSNMVLPMDRVKEKYLDEIENANFPQIRNFFLPTVSDVAKVHEDTPPGKWLAANPANVLTFGAASWFFAKQLYSKYHVPVGIINSSVGGTPIQAWITAEGIKEIPQYSSRVEKFKDTAYLASLLKPKPTAKTDDLQPDKGLTEAVKWYDTTYVPNHWHHFWMPGYWADQGVKNLNGVVWFRKEINLPTDVAGKPGKLLMGRIVDADQTYVNGKLVGNITYQYPPRRYEVPSGLLKAGKNTIVIRITNTAGKGGFVPDKSNDLIIGDQRIDLRGDWTYKVGQVFSPAKYEGEAPFSAQNEPTGLYNTMVAPVINYRVKGFVWYQGEANSGKPNEYLSLLKALITDWRSKWGDNKLPFVYAQLPNFMEVQYSPSESQWAELREAQLKALSIPNTGMAVTIDVGEWNDIHPLDKKDVGERLALAAEKVAYGDQAIVSSGPLFQSAKVDGDKILVSFSSIGKGLMVKEGGELQQFAIAGSDKKFVWGVAKIEGNQVVVSSPQIPHPAYVRYAWADNPENPNLYNQEGLPASPFRTDQ
ncbi:sialate O-acetylesterase [Mucilaginibacter agri]|uniref:Sialate O-acetylesterase n=1 Tax=Mucilaginibacter agri TaxID=2695265 RepID=A0A965ZHW5_9SPHI|nr:sialate O-acetylesterase [Mucilaginibacter agri]NCD71015.1 sialate O-acetylesterase [Mucilaginibacter agri]